MEGKLHIYHPKRRLLLWEYTPASSSTPNHHDFSPTTDNHKARTNILLFVGGLFDNFLNTSYVNDLAELFPRHASQLWSVMHVQLSSASRAWGIGDIDRDVEELSTAVDFIRTSLATDTASVVLMGHSTGCQDILYYLSNTDGKKSRARVQGAIFQASVSDREGIAEHKSELEECMRIVEATPVEKHRSTILPMDLSGRLFGPAPLSLARYLCLASPGSPQKPSREDLFSSDLSDQRLKETMGVVGRNDGVLSQGSGQRKSVLVLYSGSDEYVPAFVDKGKLVERWREAFENGGTQVDEASGVVKAAKHDISGEDGESKKARLVVMRKAVLGYLSRVVGGVGKDAWEVVDKAELEIGVDGVKL